MRVLLLLVAVALVPHAAAAQYCAAYYDGTKNCGLATLQACEQSLLGVGGTCIADNTAQLGAPIRAPSFQRFIDRVEDAEPSYPRPRSPELDDVPPPPGN